MRTGCFVILSLVRVVSGAGLSGTVEVPIRKPEEELGDLLAQGKVSAVKNGEVVAISSVTTSGAFQMSSISSPGRYVIYVSHPMLRFDPVTVTVGADGSIKANVYDLGRPSEVAAPYPLKMVATTYQSPYLAEEEFDAFQLLKNPMVVMGLVMLGMVWLMPKMQENMSPEEMKNMRKELEEDGGFAASLIKKMIPAEQTGGASSSGGVIPSISNVGKKNQ
jgi:hypothetical protein